MRDHRGWSRWRNFWDRIRVRRTPEVREHDGGDLGIRPVRDQRRDRDAQPGDEVAVVEDPRRPLIQRFSIVRVDVEGDRFIGKPVRCDAEFVPRLARIGHYAEECGLYVWVTSSLRDSTDVGGAIVEPAKRSNHMVGHAIDMNLVRMDDGGDVLEWFNSKALRAEALDPDVERFITLIRGDEELRWGGDFRKPDVVHIDDGLNVKEPDAWLAKWESRSA